MAIKEAFVQGLLFHHEQAQCWALSFLLVLRSWKQSFLMDLIGERTVEATGERSLLVSPLPYSNQSQVLRRMALDGDCISLS